MSVYASLNSECRWYCLYFWDCIVSTVPPSPELVERVRDLYHKRVPDVRFLIPVINGLEKVCLISSDSVLIIRANHKYTALMK